MNISSLFRLFTIIIVITLFPGQAQAEIPTTITYQGRLLDGAGQPLTGTTVDLTFTLFDAEVDGNSLWSETQTSVLVTDGVYSVTLGTQNTTLGELAFDQPYYLQITVGASTLNPRQSLTSVPYALRAAQIEGLTVQNGYVGIGTATPARELHIQARSGEDDVYIGFTRGDDQYAEIGYELNEGGLAFRIQDQDRFFISDAGQVGIGTIQPQAALDVQGYARVNGYVDLTGTSKLIRGLSDTYGLAIYPNSTAWDSRTWINFWNSDGAGRAGELELAGSYLNFRYGVTNTGYGQTGMILAANGNVGIGTTTPGRKLHLASSGANDVYLRLTNGAGHDADIGYDGDSDGIEFRVQGAQRMFIGNSGNIGVGTVSPSYTLDVNGTIRGSNVDPSDVRWKDDIQPLDQALERLQRMRGVSFRWKDPARGTGPQIGLIAQEVEAIFPEVVSTDSEGYKSIAYDKLVAPLIEAVKSLKVENDALKAENARMCAEFERRLSALEAALAIKQE